MRLAEWLVDQRVVYEKNPDYQGSLQVPVNRVVIKLADPGTWFIMYQNDEIDFMQKPGAGRSLVAQSDFPDQIYSSVGDFRTYYIFFDVTQPPFDKLEVRQAFSHAIDRDAINSRSWDRTARRRIRGWRRDSPPRTAKDSSGIQNFDAGRSERISSPPPAITTRRHSRRRSFRCATPFRSSSPFPGHRGHAA